MANKHEKVSTVKNTLKRFSLYLFALVLLIGIAAAAAPNITSYYPEPNTSSIEGESQEFNIKFNQNVTVVWYLNGTWVQTNPTTLDSTYKNPPNAAAGTWNVTVIATNENGTVSMEWTWFVRRYGVNLTIDSTSRNSSAGTNATYKLILNNNGTVPDTYNITVDNADNASTAILNISENITLESGASKALILNVTNMSKGISGLFRVNVTARSNNYTIKVGHINTTTTISAVRGINLTNISSLENTTTARSNATYDLRLTNNGTDPDTYNLSVTSGGASVALLNVSSISLNAGETSFITLNVTNTSAGIFYVNVTAVSTGNATRFAYINTTTNVTALRRVDLTNISMLDKITTAGTNATYYLSLTNNGSDTDSYNLTVTSGGASVSMLNITFPVILNSTETIIFTLNVTNNSAGIFYVNVTGTSWGDPSKYAYINTTTVTAVRGVDLTNISALINTTIAGANATYYLNLTNNGSNSDTYTLVVDGNGALVAALNMISVPLVSGASQTVLLNVTNSRAGIFYVNVTARSDNDPTRYSSLNTTTNVTAVRAVNFLNITGLSQTTPAGTNLTYYLNLTNNGSDSDTYTLVVDGNGASVAALNMISVPLVSGASQTVLLNVTNSRAGIFYVNVTAISDNDPARYSSLNTTTNVTAVRAVNFSNITGLSQTTPAGTNLTYYLNLTNNGSDSDTYTMGVDGNGASVAASNMISVPLVSGASQTVLLNVTNSRAGIFYVNVTARSDNDPARYSSVNTTTNVTAVRAVNFSNITGLSQTTPAGTNLTYYLNLTNNGSDSDTYTLVVDGNGASVAALNMISVPLVSGASQIVLLNVTNSRAGIFYVNVTAISDGDATKFAYINTTTTVSALRGVNLSNFSSLNNTVIAGTNATYYLSLTNNGTEIDSYNLTVTSDGASVALLNITSPISLNCDETRIFTLNVTNNSSGTFHVNVTARSNNDTIKVGHINTTTIVSAKRGVNLTNISAISSTTTAGMNATYDLRLTNNGTDPDTYNLSVTSEGASVALLNVTSVSLNAGKISFFTLNVTNTESGTFYANVTATSNNDRTKVGYVNTTTTVINATGSVNGNVTDLMLGTPISNVTITLTNTTGGTKKGETNSSGYYCISGLTTNISDPYIYTIFASKDNFTANSSLTVTVLNSTTSNTTDIRLRALDGTLRGTYFKNETSIEVSGATVTLTNTTLNMTITRTTDASGTYSASLYPANYSITVSKTGYRDNNTNATVVSNNIRTVPAIPLSPNTVTVTANRTVGSAGSGQNVSFGLTVVNTGDEATFSVVTSGTDANVISITTPSLLLLNTSNSTGYVTVEVNNSNFGGWPVTITISNSSKSASVTLNAIMRNESVNYTNISSYVDNSSNVMGATLVNTTVQNNATISGNTTVIINATVTGTDTSITDRAVIRCDYGNFYIVNSTVGESTVICSNLTGSMLMTNATVAYSTMEDSTVDNSTLNNVTILEGSTITNAADLRNITLGDVTVTGDPNYEYQAKIAGGNGWAIYQNINFTKVYDTIRISQLVIEQSPNINVSSGTNISINDSSLGTSMNFSMTVNLTNPAVINISETGISPDGAGFNSGTRLGNFLVIRSNDSDNSNHMNHILRLYFDTDLIPYTGEFKIYYYNNSASPKAWEALGTTESGIEGGRYFIEAAPNHFSTFALVRSTTTPTVVKFSGGDGNGGGGGGGGGMSGENVSNIEVIEKYDMQISKDVLTSYGFTHEKNPVMFVNITGNTSLGIITTSVEVLKSTSTLVNIPPNGLVYKNVNIWVGNSGFATPKNIKMARIKFKVNNDWMRVNGFSRSDIIMVKWDGTSWIYLDTKALSEDDASTYFEAYTRAFSSFAITAFKGAVVTSSISTVGDTDRIGSPDIPAGTENPVSMPTKKIPGFEGIIAVFVIGLLFKFKALLR